MLAAEPYLSTLSEIEEELAAEPPVDVIEGLWGRTLTVLAGQPYAGKSWLALHMALAAATSLPRKGN